MAGEIGHWCGIDLIGGGIGAVDKIDGAALQDKEGFLVITPTVFAPFSLDVDSGAGENSPQRIAPNTNPGDKRWLLTGGVFAGLTSYGDVDLIKANGSIDLSLTITGAGSYGATQRCITEDSQIMFGAFDDNYAAVANYAGQGVIQVATADLIVAAMSAGKKIKLHTGGRDAGHLRMTIGDGGVFVAGEIRSSSGYGFYTAQSSGGYWFDHIGLRNDGMFFHLVDNKIIFRKGLSDITFVIDAARNIGFGTGTPRSKLEVVGAISSATLTITASSDTTNVSGINVLFINPGAAVILGGFVGGVDGQCLEVVCIDDDQNVTLEHEEGIGGATQDIHLHAGADETLDSHFGGWSLVCDGTGWYDTSHAKHV